MSFFQYSHMKSKLDHRKAYHANFTVVGHSYLPFSVICLGSHQNLCDSIAVTYRLYDLRETGYIEREEVLEHPAFLFLLSKNVLVDLISICSHITSLPGTCLNYL